MIYYYVDSVVIADPPPKFIWAEGRERVSNPFPRPHTVGPASLGANATDADLAALGVYKLVVTERGAAPSPDSIPTTGTLTVDTETSTVQRVDGWRDPDATERAAYLKTLWADQAQARKEREARKALALPDSDDPTILKQKLNAALALLNVE